MKCIKINLSISVMIHFSNGKNLNKNVQVLKKKIKAKLYVFPYSISVKFDGKFKCFAMNTEVKFNLCLTTFVSGQIVTVGNGINDIDISFSGKFIFTGSSCHSIQTLRIDELHNQNDKANAMIHHSLFYE